VSKVLAFSPNGMGMDLLRSCSVQRARYDASDPSKTTLLRWYFCAPTAEAFPGENAFGSPVWDQDKGIQTTIGFDATASRSYYNGTRQNTSDGKSFAGPEEFFRSGQDTDAALPLGVNLTPVECLKSPVGVAIGGGLQPLPDKVSVPCFPTPIPRTVKVILSNKGLIFGSVCPYVQYEGLITFDPDWRGFPGLMIYPNGGWHGTFSNGGHVQSIGFGCGTVGPTDFSGTWYGPDWGANAAYLEAFPFGVRPTTLHWQANAQFYPICASDLYDLDLFATIR
jgi:hypothetical protein